MFELDTEALDDLIARARQSPRRRLNLNLHSSMDAPVHRLAIAMEPDSYIRPHRHALRWEMLIALRGRFDVLVFEDDGTLSRRLRLSATPEPGSCRLIEYPAGTWHTLVALDSGSVFFEVKEGPMMPPGDADWLQAAPREGEPAAPRMLQQFRTLAVGARLARE